MNIRFTAKESVEIPVKKQLIPIQHYLRQPQRLVKTIANPNLMEVLSQGRFRLKMRPLNFMEIYHFQPTVILNVWADSKGTVYVQSEHCEIKGIEYINNRFSLSVIGKLYPIEKKESTYLMGKVNLEVKVDLPPPLWLTPKPILEMTGNSLLHGVLLRIKKRLVSQLLQDYYEWVNNNISTINSSKQSQVSTTQNSLAG